jgi:hypothetical protein
MLGTMMIMSLGALTATPASAAPPTDIANFNPDDSEPDVDGGADVEVSVMSDRPDGTNSTYHAVTVTSVDATSVDWYYCATTYDGAGDPTQPAAGCTLAGSDSSGVTPPGAGSDGADEVYELNFDVPDDLVHDWVAWACNGLPKNTANCDEDWENDIQFDDASQGTAASQSSAGEITSPANGSGQSENGMNLVATTSPDVTEVTFCNDEDADAANEPATCDDTHTENTPSNPAAEQSTFKEWECGVGCHSFTASNEQAIILFETMGGTGFCAGDGTDCQLDSHYVTENPAQATTIEIAFPDFGQPGTTGDTGCAEENSINSATYPSPTLGNPAGDEEVHGCILDQSGNYITDDEDWAFQMTPEDPDALVTHELGFGRGGTSADEGEENDVNSNNFFEQVDGDVGDAGDGLAEQDFDLHTAGTYNVVFCLDADDNADDAAGQSTTPCNGEALSASGTIEVTTPVDHVHLKRSGTEGPLCHTGASSTTAQAQTTVPLVGCTLGTIGSTGNEQPSAGNHVLWITNPAGNPQDPAQVVTQENTSDNAGKADASVTSGAGAAEKTSTIRFCLDNFPNPAGTGLGNGICDGLEAGSGFGSETIADFQINWTAAAQPPPPDCSKAKQRVKKLQRKLRQAINNDADRDKIRRIRRQLRRARANLRRCLQG